jgi:hypothetical protein
MIIHYLPKELIHLILDYDGRIKFYKGKYIINIDYYLYDCIKFYLEHRRYVLSFFNFPNNNRLISSIYILNIEKHEYYNKIFKTDEFMQINFIEERKLDKNIFSKYNNKIPILHFYQYEYLIINKTNKHISSGWYSPWYNN